MNNSRNTLPILRIAVVGENTLCGEVSAWVAMSFPLGVQLVTEPDEQTWALIVCGDVTRPSWDASRVVRIVRNSTAVGTNGSLVLWPSATNRLFGRINEWRYRTRAGVMAEEMFDDARLGTGELRLPDFGSDPVALFIVRVEAGELLFEPRMVTREGWQWIGSAPQTEALRLRELESLGVSFFEAPIRAALEGSAGGFSRTIHPADGPTRPAHHLMVPGTSKSEYAVIDVSWIESLNDRIRRIDARMSDVVALAGEYVWETDAGGCLTYLSPRAADVHGFPLEYFIGTNPIAQTAFENVGRGGRWLRERFAEGTEFRGVRATVRHASGRELCLEIHGTPMQEDGEFVGFRGLTQDVTAEVESSRRLEESESRYRIVTEFASDMIVQHRVDGEIIYVSPACQAILGRAPEDLQGHRLDDYLHPDDVRRFRWTIDLMADGADGTVEVRATHKDGHYSWLEILMRRVYAVSDGADDTFVSVARDVTERRRLQAVEQQQRRTIEFLAFNDAMTRLPNRAQFQAQLHSVDEAVGRGEASYSVILVDCDRFKQVNDLYGHPIGDEFLRNVASRLQAFGGKNGVVARVGGDEFAVLRLSDPDEDPARIAEGIRSSIAQPMMVDGLALQSSVSIGIASCPDDGADSQTVLTLADHALYEAKRLGGDRAIHYRDSMHRALMETRLGSHDIEDALTREHFELHYQPIVDVEACRVIGVEALVRWHHPERGLLLPHRFIGDAETSRIIIPLGLWVLRQACEESAALCRDAGYPIAVHVNVSAVQFASESFVEDVKRVIDLSGIDPTCVVLEITESSLVQSFDAAERTIAALREVGLRIAIDDFGVGYSSLSYLARLPVQCLKIDRSFVPVDGSSSHPVIPLVEGMVELGARLGLIAVGEGVETPDQMEALRGAGCFWQQGFYFARPEPMQQTLATIRRIETQGLGCVGADDQ